MLQRDAFYTQTWYADVPRRCRGAILAGAGVAFLFFGGFGVWATTAPISGAVVANGSFVARGQNKVVQSFEGGVIADIMVNEGDVVEKGETLVRLDETAAKVDLRRLLLRRARLEATEVRLLREAGETRDQLIPAAYREEMPKTDVSDTDVRSMVAIQSMTYDAHVQSVMNDITNLQQNIRSLEDHLQGDEVQKAASLRMLALYDQEIQSKEGLLSKGLIRRSEMLALQRAKASVEGEVGRLQGDIGDTHAKIARTNDQIRGVRAQAVKTAMDQLVDIRSDLIDTRERIRTAGKTADRILVAAPVRGIVVKLGYHTSGGVIEPGKPIMEILPLGEELLIESRIRAQDIDNVKKGADANVRLTALSARVTPMVSGKVVYLSADSLQEDPRIDRSAGVYLARVRINKDQLQLVKNFVPTPGMPAEVYIKTSERTFFDYLMRPVHDSMARAFRER